MSDRLPKIVRREEFSHDDNREIWEMTLEEIWAYDQKILKGKSRKIPRAPLTVGNLRAIIPT
jgi:hypothetical protein